MILDLEIEDSTISLMLMIKRLKSTPGTVDSRRR
jgi:hypothetical protein